MSDNTFSTRLEILVYTHPVGAPANEWHHLEDGPGFFTIPEGQEGSVRLRYGDDAKLAELAEDLRGCKAVRSLILAENRNISDSGLKVLAALTQLTMLNLSSCDITNQGLEHLSGLTRLNWLDLSYCNRLTDPALKLVKSLTNLTYLNLQGCSKMTNGGLARARRANLTIKK